MVTRRKKFNLPSIRPLAKLPERDRENKFNEMSEYKCECCEHELECTGVVIRIIDGKATHDIKCPCGKYMKLANPKTGIASFGSDRYGRVR